MDKTLIWAVGILSAYLIGSIPFGYLIGRLRGVDVRTVGSKNIGATNVYRTVGHFFGIMAFSCDFLKGLIPTLAAKSYAAADPSLCYLPLAVGFACVVGHTLTVFMHFKGGKGVASAFGMMVALSPWLVLTAFAIFVVTVAVSHYISLGSCVAAAFLSVAVWFPIPWLGTRGFHDVPLCVLTTLLTAFVIYKHKANICRLAHGCENKIY